MAGIDQPGGPRDVHMVVPAYIGLAHYQAGVGDYEASIRAAKRGLEIAEGTGYRLWAVHRLLPILAEACLWAGHIDEAEAVGKRMRTHAEALRHKLGLAWSDACDALVCWKRGDPVRGAVLMRQAAEALEEIPMIPYAVRIRRQLAGRLADIGDTEGALAELRRVHDVLARLGAEEELEKARIQFREIGHRPPPRGVGEGVAGLTGRELEIARLVARRKSNKAIGKELGISPRTVSTHLSNIFQKLDCREGPAIPWPPERPAGEVWQGAIGKHAPSLPHATFPPLANASRVHQQFPAKQVGQLCRCDHPLRFFQIPFHRPGHGHLRPRVPPPLSGQDGFLQFKINRCRIKASGSP